MPADSEIGFETDAFRVLVDESSKESVSEIVDGGAAERREMRDSMAAMGWVMRGSVRSRLL